MEDTGTNFKEKSKKPMEQPIIKRVKLEPPEPEAEAMSEPVEEPQNEQVQDQPEEIQEDQPPAVEQVAIEAVEANPEPAATDS